MVGVGEAAPPVTTGLAAGPEGLGLGVGVVVRCDGCALGKICVSVSGSGGTGSPAPAVVGTVPRSQGWIGL